MTLKNDCRCSTGVEFRPIMWLIPIPPKPWAPRRPFVPILDTSFIFPAFWIARHHGYGWREGRGRSRQIWIDPLQDASWSPVAMGARFLDTLGALKDPIVKEICHVSVDFCVVVIAEWRNLNLNKNHLPSLFTGYFMYDFFDMLFNQKLSQSWELLFHHLVVGLTSISNISHTARVLH